MDFAVDLLETVRGKLSIFVIIDHLSKQVHFISFRNTTSVPATTQLFLDYVYQLHKILETITSNCNEQFISKF
jgi:hypothetical protein